MFLEKPFSKYRTINQLLNRSELLRELRGLSFLFTRPWFPLLFQILFLLFLFLLIAGGLGANTSDMTFARILRNTNLANLIVWSYWWPLVIVGAILFGRLWCTVCPVELVTSGLSKYGLRKKVPRWLRTGWLITIFFLLLLVVGIHTLAIHRVPFRMSLYLLLLLALGIVFGLVFEKRALCNHLCPVGPLLGFYAFCSPFAIRVRDRELCRNCSERGCIAPENYYKYVGRSCTSELYPATLSHNRDCIACSQCFKSCSYDNLGVFARMPFKDIFSGIRLSGAQTFLLYLVSGFVVYEILSEWETTKNVLIYVPERVAALLGITDPSLVSLTAALVMFLLYPLIWWVAPALANKLKHPESGIWEYMKKVAVYFIPIAAGAHLLKSLLKTTSRIPYIEYSLRDPMGIETAKALSSGTLVLDKGLVNSFQPFITFVGISIFIIAILVALSALRRNLKNKADFSFIPAAFGILTYGMLFLLAVCWWRL